MCVSGLVSAMKFNDMYKDGHLTRQYIPFGNSSAELTDDWQNIFVKEEQYNLIDSEDLE
jgi:hypothetical protein